MWRRISKVLLLASLGVGGCTELIPLATDAGDADLGMRDGGVLDADSPDIGQVADQGPDASRFDGCVPGQEVCNGLDDNCDDIADNASISELCGQRPNVATAYCDDSSDSCRVLFCTPGGHSDANGDYLDGCECDPVDNPDQPDTCVGATNSVSVPAGATVNLSGTIEEVGDADWWPLNLNLALSGELTIELTSDPSGTLRLEVVEDCAASFLCGSSTQYTREHCATSEAGYQGCSAPDGTFFVRVYDSSGTNSCLPYTLRVANLGECTSGSPGMRTAYRNPYHNASNQCESEVQTGTCSGVNWAWSGSYQHDSCPRCTGTPAACSAYGDTTTCAAAGCLIAGCNDPDPPNPWNCASLTVQACASYPGCTVSGSSCTGGTHSCIGLTQADCSAAAGVGRGCIYQTAVCGGTPRTCGRTGSANDCTMQGCTWNY